ncbi:MAG: P1 family peptidase [Desulfobacterales bacterium]|nr:P1 family peptidase [Desulfobacterales bacterium]
MTSRFLFLKEQYTLSPGIRDGDTLEVALPKIGKNNALTDVAGLIVGNYTDINAVCGVTVVICPKGAVAGVDVRGAAPATREIELLEPLNLVEKIHAVVLSGGSVYGLAASDGVVRWLSGLGFGFPLGQDHVAPIVPAAALYDLGRSTQEFVPPISAAWGISACDAAKEGPIEIGCVGAGTGAQSGSIKGGLGTASIVIESKTTLAALVAVNSFGEVVNPKTGRLWETDSELGKEFGHQGKRAITLPPFEETSPAKNTTIGIVATDAILTKPQAQKIAQMAHDGLARAVRPAHTMFDGDTIFCLSTGKKKLPESSGFFSVPGAQAINELGHAAADCMSRAIIRGILSARTLAGIQAFCDLKNREHL